MFTAKFVGGRGTCGGCGNSQEAARGRQGFAEVARGRRVHGVRRVMRRGLWSHLGSPRDGQRSSGFVQGSLRLPSLAA